MNCTLKGCGFKAKGNVGYAAHKRGHLLRGEATTNTDGSITSTGIPIAITKQDRKERHTAIENGEIIPEIRVHQNTSAVLVESREVGKTSKIPTILKPMSVDNRLQSMLGEDSVLKQDEHSCATTRAIDRIKDAAAITSFAMMLDEYPPDQLMIMLSHMKGLPNLVRARQK